MSPIAAYRERDAILRDLGYPDYKAYLASPLWQSIRRTVMAAHQGKCGICRQKASEVHHVHYTREALLGHGLLHYLPVCRSCHKKHEFSRDGRKVSPAECFRSMQAEFLSRTKASKRQPGRKGKVAVRAAIRHKRNRTRK